MPTTNPEEGPVKATRRRTASASIVTSTPDVTEAKRPASASVSNASGITLPVTETPHGAEEEIRRRAYELYEQDGRQHGRDREHWLRAEAEVLGGNAARSLQRGQKSA